MKLGYQITVQLTYSSPINMPPLAQHYLNSTSCLSFLQQSFLHNYTWRPPVNTPILVTYSYRHPTTYKSNKPNMQLTPKYSALQLLFISMPFTLSAYVHHSQFMTRGLLLTIFGHFSNFSSYNFYSTASTIIKPIFP